MKAPGWSIASSAGPTARRVAAACGLLFTLGAGQAAANHEPETLRCVYVSAASECDGVSANTYATLQSALNAAQAHSGKDTVHLVEGTHQGPAVNGGGADPLDIEGEGASSTTVTTPTGQAPGSSVLDASGGNVVVRDLAVSVPGDDQNGLRLAGDDAKAERISVTLAPTATSGSGVALTSGADLEGSSVEGPITAGSSPTGVATDGGGSNVRGADLTASLPLVMRGDGRVERTRTTGYGGVSVAQGQVSAEDLLIESNGPDAVQVVPQAPSTTAALTLRHATVIYTGATAGRAVLVQSPENNQGAELTLSDSIFAGNLNYLAWRGSFGTSSTANLTADRVNRPVGAQTLDQTPGSGGAIVDTNPSTDDPRFVGNGDHRLRADSPLIDAGTPTAFTGEQLSDLDGSPRIVDGKLPSDAVRDFGAFEFQPLSPAAVLSGPGSLQPGQQGSFSAGGSGDPNAGDALSYAWEVDGATVPGATGTTLQRSFATRGPHTVEVTVTDLAGRQDSATRAVTVPAAASTGTSGGGTSTGGNSTGTTSGGLGGTAAPVGPSTAAMLSALKLDLRGAARTLQRLGARRLLRRRVARVRNVDALRAGRVSVVGRIGRTTVLRGSRAFGRAGRATLRLGLTRRGRRLLARRRRVRIVLRGTFVAPNGQKATARRSLRVR